MLEFAIQETDLTPDEWRRELFDPACGGYVSFEGWVRNENEGQEVLRLEYQAYDALAVKEGERILAEALEKFPISHAKCVHRVGELEIRRHGCLGRCQRGTSRRMLPGLPLHH